MTSANSSAYKYVLQEVVDSLLKGDAYRRLEKLATRYAYAEAIIEVGEKNPDVVVLDADVANSIKTTEFRNRFPDREFNFGIAEQNMMAAAAGMASTGLIPFVSTYAVFASLRALDQLRNSIHYPRLNVKVAASHSGITPGPDGVTHQAQEDMSILRCLANSTVIAPGDPVSTKMAIHAVAEYDGPAYISFTRDPTPYLYPV